MDDTFIDGYHSRGILMELVLLKQNFEKLFGVIMVPSLIVSKALV